MRIKLRNFIFALYMSGIMSFFMSGVVTLINLEVLKNGLSYHFFSAWFLKAFPSSYLIALPIAIFIVPFVAKLTNATLKRIGHSE